MIFYIHKRCMYTNSIAIYVHERCMYINAIAISYQHIAGIDIVSLLFVWLKSLCFYVRGLDFVSSERGILV